MAASSSLVVPAKRKQVTVSWSGRLNANKFFFVENSLAKPESIPENPLNQRELLRLSFHLLFHNVELFDDTQDQFIRLYLGDRDEIIEKEVFFTENPAKVCDSLFDRSGRLKNLSFRRLVYVHKVKNRSCLADDVDNRIQQIHPVCGRIFIGSETLPYFEKSIVPKKTFEVKEAEQYSLFDFEPVDVEAAMTTFQKAKIKSVSAQPSNGCGYFQIQNRRYLGNKFKLLGFIEDIVREKCGEYRTFCDLFAGTGVVGYWFNKKTTKIISNDILFSNYVPLATFLLLTNMNIHQVGSKIAYLNSFEGVEENYFSKNFGDTYYSMKNARKIGEIRAAIDTISENEQEKNVLLTSLLYAADKVANTVGHFDAYRKRLDSVQPIKLLLPWIETAFNESNEVYREDANTLIKKLECDVLYLDPPYNSRQYCDAYHLLENITIWNKPEVFGKAKKMDRSGLKSEYCLKNASRVFEDLIRNAKAKHILVSYNNTGESKDERSNARIQDAEMLRILREKGNVEIFERCYKAFTTGKSEVAGNLERIFYCKVKD